MSEPRERTRVGLLAVLLLVSHVWLNEAAIPFGNPNVLSRAYLTLAMTEGTFRIDRWVEYTDIQDKAEYDGHTYSDKAPGASLLLVPLALALRAFIADPEVYEMARWLRLLGLSLPVIGFWLLGRRYYAALVDDPPLADALVLVGALGTVFFVYATELFAHATAGMLLFGAFVLACGVMRDPRAERVGPACVVAGALAGLAFTVDYVVMLAVPVLLLGVLRDANGRVVRGGLFLAGCAVPLLAWMAYNVACFDHPLRVGFHFHADSEYGSQYRGGILGIQLPSPGDLWLLLFSASRGLCFLSPVLLLALGGWYRQWGRSETRAEAVVSAAIVAAVVLFAATTIDPGGGWAVASRYLTPTIPFFLVGIAGWLRHAAPWAVVLYAGLAMVGLTLVPLAAATFPVFPHGVENPLYELAWPLLRYGYVMPSLASQAGQVAALAPFFLCFAAAAVVQLMVVQRRQGLAGVAAALALAVLIVAVQATIPARPERARWRAFGLEFALDGLGYDAAAERVRAAGTL